MGTLAVWRWSCMASPGSVFDLVVLAWSGLASGLGPLLVLRCFDREVPPRLAGAMIIGALFAVAIWRFALELTGAVYDVVPGSWSALGSTASDGPLGVPVRLRGRTAVVTSAAHGIGRAWRAASRAAGDWLWSMSPRRRAGRRPR